MSSWPSDSTTLLPEGGEHVEAHVAEGTYATGPSSSSRYAVRLVRDPGGALSFELDTKLPLATGESHRVVTADGKVVSLPDGAPPLPAGMPTFVLPLCGDITRHVGRGGVTTFDAVTGLPCTATSLYGVTLKTPTSNVAEIRRVEVVDKTLASLMTMLVGGPFFLAGAADTAIGVASPGARTVLLATGVPLVAIALSIFVASAPTLFASDRTTVLYPPAPDGTGR